MAEESDVEVKFGASIEGLTAGVAEAKEAIEGLTEPIAGIMESFSGLAEALGAALAFEKISEFAEHMGELGEQTERLSKILGVSTEEIGKLSFAAAMTGTDTANLSMMMGRFEAALPEAETGIGRVAAGLRSLGLSAKELAAENPSQQLREIAEATSRFADGPAKMAALQDMGRGFVNLIPLLDEGKEGFDRLAEGAEKAGVVLDDISTSRLVDMQHAIVNLEQSIKGLTIEAFAPFVDVVNGAVAIFTDIAQSFRESAQAGGLLHDALGLVARALQEVEQFVGETILIIKDLNVAGDTATQALAAAFMGFGKVVADVFQALGAAIPAFFTALVTAGEEAVKAVEKQFVDLGTVIGDTLSLNFAGAKAAFGAMGDDASASSAKIAGAFHGVFDFSTATSDAKVATDGVADAINEGQKQILNNAIDAQREYNRIWGVTARHGEGEGEGLEGKKPANAMPVEQKGGKKDNSAEKLAEAEAQSDIDAAKRAATEREKLLDEQLKTHQITMGQWLQQTTDALQDEEQDIKAAYDKELETAGLTSAQIVNIKRKEADAIADIEQKIRDANYKAAEESAKEWKGYADTTAGIFNSQVDPLLRGTESIGTAIKNMTATAIEDVVKFCIKWAAEHAAAVAANIAGIGLQTGAEAGSASTSLATVLAQKAAVVAADAGTAAAGVAAWLAPIIGPAAVPAGAAAGAQVLGIGAMDIGAYNLPSDQLALVHKGELVMPAPQADAFRSMLDKGDGGGGGAAGGGETHVHFHVNAMDRSSVGDFFHEHSDHIISAINKGVGGGQHFGLKNLR